MEFEWTVPVQRAGRGWGKGCAVVWCVMNTQHMFDRFVGGHANALSLNFLSESRAGFKFVMLLVVIVVEQTG